jgi:hypothetical protein
LDSDNDGITDIIEAGGTDIGNDGIADGASNPTTGIPVAAGFGFVPGNTDSDGLKNPYDLDSDNDGISDLTEGGGTDLDLDGIHDGTPNPLTGLVATPLTPPNTDGDSKPNYCDIDSDNDGINDVKENPLTADLDTDNDGIIDGTDTDRDGIIDTPQTDTQMTSGIVTATYGGSFQVPADTDQNGLPNYLQGPDTDGDGVADTADLDDDNDGILDTTEGFSDNDGDGIISSLDLDSDGDGISDVTETNGTDNDKDGKADQVGAATSNGIPSSAGTGVIAPINTDGDTKPDFLDLDSDNDGLTDVSEVNGVDDNNNGLADGFVGATGFATTAGNGLTPINTDAPAPIAGVIVTSDNRPDYRDLDSDDDGMPDVLEAGGIDSGRDGIADGIPNTDGMPIANGLIKIDTDNDDTPDFRDIDSDNDGIKDTKENATTAGLDANNDGKIDGTDTDNDGIINVPAIDPNTTYGGFYSQPTDNDNNTLPNYKQPLGTQLAMKVMLQGALMGSIDGLMRDNLRIQNLIPLASPYDVILGARFTKVAETAVATTTNTVLTANAGTQNAIVDWVFIEIRNGAAAGTVVKTVSALVQRDGDIVGADGLPLYVNMALGNYFVSVKHRNHLGAMISNTVAFNGSLATLDFTSMTNAQLYNNAGYDGYEMVTVGSVKALWAGNCNVDNKTKYDGTATDQQKISSNVTTFATNTTTSFTFNNAIGYFAGDVNMDGKVKYDGNGNDRILIQQLVQSFGLNVTGSNNYNNLVEQLP